MKRICQNCKYWIWGKRHLDPDVGECNNTDVKYRLWMIHSITQTSVGSNISESILQTDNDFGCRFYKKKDIE